MNPEFQCGVVEGFYGRPWTFAQRHRLIGWLKQFGLNTYCFAPKDDLKHRVLWRESLEPTEADEFRKLIDECRRNNVRFIYSISPGWDGHFSDSINRFDPQELVDGLQTRFEQLLQMGCQHFSIQFDDVPNLSIEQRHQLALWHAETCDALHNWLLNQDRTATMAMCPAVYCGAMANGLLQSCDYLQVLGSNLDREVQIWWTGPEIISESISSSHLTEVAELLNRPPLIWDNLNANDYDPSRPQMGPFSRRSSDITNVTSGVLINPNIQFELNFVPLHTLGQFIETGECDLDVTIDAWMPEWERLSGESFSKELVQRVIECFWLPHQNGRYAQKLLESSVAALTGNREALKAIRTAADEFGKSFYDLATLKNRDLLDALWSPIWRLKDELELISQIVEKHSSSPVRLPDFPRGVVRGGIISQLQELIESTEAGYQLRE